MTTMRVAWRWLLHRGAVEWHEQLQRHPSQAGLLFSIKASCMWQVRSNNRTTSV